MYMYTACTKVILTMVIRAGTRMIANVPNQRWNIIPQTLISRYQHVHPRPIRTQSYSHKRVRGLRIGNLQLSVIGEGGAGAEIAYQQP